MTFLPPTCPVQVQMGSSDPHFVWFHLLLPAPALLVPLGFFSHFSTQASRPMLLKDGKDGYIYIYIYIYMYIYIFHLFPSFYSIGRGACVLK